jgi:hypothetical protein
VEAEQKEREAFSKKYIEGINIASACIRVQDEKKRTDAEFLAKNPASITGDPCHPRLGGKEWTVVKGVLYFGEVCCICFDEVGQDRETIEFWCNKGYSGSRLHRVLICVKCVHKHPTVPHDSIFKKMCSNKCCALRQTECVLCNEPIWTHQGRRPYEGGPSLIHTLCAY